MIHSNMDLPDELLLLIFALGVFDLNTRWILANVCQKWRRVVSDLSLWRGQMAFTEKDQWTMGPTENGCDYFDDTNTSDFHIFVDEDLLPKDHELFEWLFLCAESVAMGNRPRANARQDVRPFPFDVLGLPGSRATKLTLSLPNDAMPVALATDLHQRITSLALLAPDTWFTPWRTTIITMPQLDSLHLNGWLTARSWRPDQWPTDAFTHLCRLHVDYMDDSILLAIAQRSREHLVELYVSDAKELCSGHEVAKACPRLTRLVLARAHASFLIPLASQLVELQIKSILPEDKHLLPDLVRQLPIFMKYCFIYDTIVTTDPTWTWTHLLQGHTLRELTLTVQAPRSGEQAFNDYVKFYAPTHQTDACAFEDDREGEYLMGLHIAEKGQKTFFYG